MFLPCHPLTSTPGPNPPRAAFPWGEAAQKTPAAALGWCRDPLPLGGNPPVPHHTERNTQKGGAGTQARRQVTSGHRDSVFGGPTRGGGADLPGQGQGRREPAWRGAARSRPVTEGWRGRLRGPAGTAVAADPRRVTRWESVSVTFRGAEGRRCSKGSRPRPCSQPAARGNRPSPGALKTAGARRLLGHPESGWSLSSGRGISHCPPAVLSTATEEVGDFSVGCDQGRILWVTPAGAQGGRTSVGLSRKGFMAGCWSPFSTKGKTEDAELLTLPEMTQSHVTVLPASAFNTTVRSRGWQNLHGRSRCLGSGV